MDAEPLLFVYGTLMRGFPLHALLAGRADSVGDGEVAGLLFIWAATRPRCGTEAA